MTLAYLKLHFRPAHHSMTACGRLAPGWAKRTTPDEDFVTCESCLEVLVQQALLAIRESGMSTVEILERRG